MKVWSEFGSGRCKEGTRVKNYVLSFVLSRWWHQQWFCPPFNLIYWQSAVSWILLDAKNAKIIKIYALLLGISWFRGVDRPNWKNRCDIMYVLCVCSMIESWTGGSTMWKWLTHLGKGFMVMTFELVVRHWKDCCQAEQGEYGIGGE